MSDVGGSVPQPSSAACENLGSERDEGRRRTNAQNGIRLCKLAGWHSRAPTQATLSRRAAAYVQGGGAQQRGRALPSRCQEVSGPKGGSRPRSRASKRTVRDPSG